MAFIKCQYTDDYLLTIDIAIKNEKNYCEDIEELEHSVGSRVGLLIEELRDIK